LNGVSYLAISQYKVAALQPPSLKAICPWEGFSDFYQDLGRPGGIREDGFVIMWGKLIAPYVREQQYNHLLRDEWYKSLCADLKKITVPALICGSFSDHCLHTRGSYRLFNQISSKHKWLYTHREGKWAAYYSKEALTFQLKFFDYFLRGYGNDMLSISPVRLEVRENRDKITEVSYHNSWPIPSTKWQSLYLDANSMNLTLQPSYIKTNASFELIKETLSFTWKIQKKLKIIRPMKAVLYVELEGCNDANIFAGVRKFQNENHIPFEGSYGFGGDMVTKGWLKASLRNLSPDLSTPWESQHTFDKQELLKPKQIVCLEISLLPSATLFHKDDILRLDIQGEWFYRKNPFFSQFADYEKSLPGKSIIHCGNEYKSLLLIPVIERDEN
jgi:putative CocE/NonD family hydrolase